VRARAAADRKGDVALADVEGSMRLWENQPDEMTAAVTRLAGAWSGRTPRIGPLFCASRYLLRAVAAYPAHCWSVSAGRANILPHRG
jgi:hypothetical protein